METKKNNYIERMILKDGDILLVLAKVISDELNTHIANYVDRFYHRVVKSSEDETAALNMVSKSFWDIAFESIKEFFTYELLSVEEYNNLSDDEKKYCVYDEHKIILPIRLYRTHYKIDSIEVEKTDGGIIISDNIGGVLSSVKLEGGK